MTDQRRALPPSRVPLPTLRFSPLAMAALMLAAVALAGAVMVWQRLSATQEQLARQSGESAMHAAEAPCQRQGGAGSFARNGCTAGGGRGSAERGRGTAQSARRPDPEHLALARRKPGGRHRICGPAGPAAGAANGSVSSWWLRCSRPTSVWRAQARPGLAKLQRALARDISRITASSYTDTPSLLARIDELLRMSDELPLANAVAGVGRRLAEQDAPLAPEWWQRVLAVVGEEASKLLRVSRVEQPEAVLLSPEQSFFVRENYKLKLLNARLGLLARQLESARADMASASTTLFRYFDPGLAQDPGGGQPFAAGAGTDEEPGIAARRRYAGGALRSGGRALRP